jgi:hypothetical protein
LRRCSAWWSLSGFRDSSVGFWLQQACETTLKAGSTPRAAWLPSTPILSPGWIGWWNRVPMPERSCRLQISSSLRFRPDPTTPWRSSLQMGRFCSASRPHYSSKSRATCHDASPDCTPTNSFLRIDCPIKSCTLTDT